ncbi:MAG: acylphosphatase [Magnetococcales bacterium]|nr:acylphosphatase [Magnetococcales bacterium]
METHSHTICRRLIIRGRVQGVWYRASTRNQAVKLGLSGWVQNLADGSVAVLVSGPPHDVLSLIEWCRQGPPGARVEQVDIEECHEPAPSPGFEIKR